MKRIILALVLLASSHAMLQAQSTSDRFGPNVQKYITTEAPTIALTNANLIDGTGTAMRAGQTVVIQEGTIISVGPTASTLIPDGAEIIDLNGHTVMPGIVGMHNHTFYTTSRRSVQMGYTAQRLYLGTGVTTVRTTGNHTPYNELNMAQAIADGEQPGPDVIASGPYLTGGSGSGSMNRVSTAEEARRVVRYWASEGVTWFKAYTLISREALGAAIDEAHKLGVKVTAHLCSVSFREATALGIDNVEHGLFANTDYYEGKVPDECPDDYRIPLADVDPQGEDAQQTFREMIDAGVAMTSTLAVYEMYVPNRPPLEDRWLKYLSPETQSEVRATHAYHQEIGQDPGYAFSEKLLQTAMAYERAFVAAGGLLAAGVDPTGVGMAPPGLGDQRNFLLLREAGFSTEEVVQIMTLNGAKILEMEDRIGSVEAGKQADLVVLEGDLTNTDQVIYNVRHVFKEGVGFNPALLMQDAEGRVGLN